MDVQKRDAEAGRHLPRKAGSAEGKEVGRETMAAAIPILFIPGCAMNATSVMRYTILAISLAAMVVGVLMMLGIMVPRNFPGQYGIILGATVFLYGLYRFVVAYYRQSKG